MPTFLLTFRLDPALSIAVQVDSFTAAELNLCHEIEVIAGDFSWGIISIGAKVVQNRLGGLEVAIIHRHLMDALH